MSTNINDDLPSHGPGMTYIAIWIAAVAIVGALYFNFKGRGVTKALVVDRFQEFPLIKKTALSHNVAIYRFGLPFKNAVMGVPTGQHVTLAVKAGGKEVLRSYTPISSDAEDQGYVDILIKSYPQGIMSSHVANLKINDTLKMRGPKGAMTYSANKWNQIGMIAGGTGIAPMLQIIKAIHRARPVDRTKVDLIFANVTYDDILLKKELDEIAATDSQIKIYYVLNKPPQDWHGGVGFVTADMIKQRLPPPGPDGKICICGPPPMVTAMKKATESLGYAKARPVSKVDDQVFCF